MHVILMFLSVLFWVTSGLTVMFASMICLVWLIDRRQDRHYRESALDELLESKESP